MVCILSSPNITGRCPNFWPCGKWCDLHVTNIPPSSSSKLLIASGVMFPTILVAQSFWAVIASQVVVLDEATILILVVGDGEHLGWWIFFLSLFLLIRLWHHVC